MITKIPTECSSQNNEGSENIDSERNAYICMSVKYSLKLFELFLIVALLFAK